MPDNRILRGAAALASLAALFFLAGLPVAGQTNVPPPGPPAPAASLSGNGAQSQTNDALALMRLSEQFRAECISGRRRVCGRVLQVFPDGLVVDSGYTNLLREPLTRSWLVPGKVSVVPSTNLLESTEPGAICVGRIFLTDLPKSRGAKPARYDYIIIEAYPTGERTYTSVGTVTHTVRRFSASLSKAVDFKMKAAMQTTPPAASAK